MQRITYILSTRVVQSFVPRDCRSLRDTSDALARPEKRAAQPSIFSRPRHKMHLHSQEFSCANDAALMSRQIRASSAAGFGSYDCIATYMKLCHQSTLRAQPKATQVTYGIRVQSGVGSCHGILECAPCYIPSYDAEHHFAQREPCKVHVVPALSSLCAGMKIHSHTRQGQVAKDLYSTSAALRSIADGVREFLRRPFEWPRPGISRCGIAWKCKRAEHALLEAAPNAAEENPRMTRITDAERPHLCAPGAVSRALLRSVARAPGVQSRAVQFSVLVHNSTVLASSALTLCDCVSSPERAHRAQNQMWCSETDHAQMDLRCNWCPQAVSGNATSHKGQTILAVDCAGSRHSCSLNVPASRSQSSRSRIISQVYRIYWVETEHDVLVSICLDGIGRRAYVCCG